MTVKEFFENFEDKGGSVIRIVAENGSFDTRIGYNYIDKKHSMWRNFMAMYGNYLVTAWYFDTEDTYKVATVYVEEDKGEGKFDYCIRYNVRAWDNELEEYRIVHKSQLSATIEDAFLRGGYNMKIGCAEREYESKD